MSCSYSTKSVVRIFARHVCMHVDRTLFPEAKTSSLCCLGPCGCSLDYVQIPGVLFVVYVVVGTQSSDSLSSSTACNYFLSGVSHVISLLWLVIRKPLLIGLRGSHSRRCRRCRGRCSRHCSRHRRRRRHLKAAHYLIIT